MPLENKAGAEQRKRRLRHFRGRDQPPRPVGNHRQTQMAGISQHGGLPGAGSSLCEPGDHDL